MHSKRFGDLAEKLPASTFGMLPVGDYCVNYYELRQTSPDPPCVRHEVEQFAFHTERAEVGKSRTPVMLYCLHYNHFILKCSGSGNKLTVHLLLRDKHFVE